MDQSSTSFNHDNGFLNNVLGERSDIGSGQSCSEQSGGGQGGQTGGVQGGQSGGGQGVQSGGEQSGVEHSGIGDDGHEVGHGGGQAGSLGRDNCEKNDPGHRSRYGRDKNGPKVSRS